MRGADTGDRRELAINCRIVRMAAVGEASRRVHRSDARDDCFVVLDTISGCYPLSGALDSQADSCEICESELSLGDEATASGSNSSGFC